ncbi:hypothetical protein CYMTET_35491, partial [Cymbomonas tetramitiformis]
RNIPNNDFEMDGEVACGVIAVTGWGGGDRRCIVPNGNASEDGCTFDSDSGDYYISLEDNDAYIDQTLEGLTVSHLYWLTWRMAACAIPNALSLSINDEVVWSGSAPTTGFVTQSYQWMSTSTSPNIKFSNTGTNNNAIYFDYFTIIRGFEPPPSPPLLTTTATITITSTPPSPPPPSPPPPLLRSRRHPHSTAYYYSLLSLPHLRQAHHLQPQAPPPQPVSPSPLHSHRSSLRSTARAVYLYPALSTESSLVTTATATTSSLPPSHASLLRRRPQWTVVFDGIDDYLLLPILDSLWDFSCWVKVDIDQPQ